MQYKDKRILIVEDEPIFSEYLRDILTKEGYDVIGTVDSGEDAINQAIRLKPNLILMDIMLKGRMSGCEAAVKIYQLDRDIKIIFLTAYADEDMIDYAMEVDAVAYLMKPYREEEILATIKLIFSHKTKSILSKKSEESIGLNNGYIFNTKQNRLFKENQEIRLGKKTLKLVEILVKNRNISVSNEQICSYVWGEPKNDRTLRSLIYRIRHMVGCDMIENINGIGYKIK